ncbi:hypothetical protein ACFZB6_19765 [Streptomyces syringium]|uniref:hypothetical protein n=1 Tax=Streptomyces syringium TaxID=76729 RepID=UPI0036F14A15
MRSGFVGNVRSEWVDAGVNAGIIAAVTVRFGPSKAGAMSVKKKSQDFAFYVMPVISPGLTIGFTALANESSGSGKFAFFVAAVVAAVIAPFLSSLLRKRYRRIEGIKFEAAMSAIVDHMGTLVGAKPAQVPRILGQIHDRLITVVANGASPKARSAFYSLGGDGCFDLEVVHGQATPPERFDRKTEKALINVLNQGQIVYIHDNRNTNGNLKINLGDDHLSAIVAPVCAGSEPQGVLIIDAPKVGDLPEGKVRKPYLMVITGMLGTAHALGRLAMES